MKENVLRTKFPWRAALIATVLFLLTVFSAINLLIQSEKYGFVDLFLSLFSILLLLYFLFIWDLTIIEFHTDEVKIFRPFRLKRKYIEIKFSEIELIQFAHVIIGVPRFLFHLHGGKHMRIRYFQAGGLKELRNISRFLKKQDVSFVYKRFGAKDNSSL